MNEGTIQKIFNNIMAATSQLYGLSYIIGLLYLTFLKIISYIKFCVPQSPPAGGGGIWVTFCWVCAAGLSEPLTHSSLFSGLL